MPDMTQRVCPRDIAAKRRANATVRRRRGASARQCNRARDIGRSRERTARSGDHPRSFTQRFETLRSMPRACIALVVVALTLLAGSCGTPIADIFGEVQGELCTNRGSPVRNAHVLVDGRPLRTDADGHFRAFAVRPGRVSVVVDDKHLDVVVPESDIAVVFDEGCRSSDRDAPPFAPLGIDAVPPRA
jgi:hypothetical protein